MSENARLKTTILGKLVLTVLVAGALLAGLMLPWIGGSGLAARNSASLLDALPDALTDETPAGMTRVLSADGKLITFVYDKNRTPLASDEISDVMKQALVDIEDSRFYRHNGLDVEGTMRALMRNLSAGSVQEGGSTLTQQLVKQTLLQTADTAEERDAAVAEDLGRKLREARMAMAMEEEFSKDEILTRYLNIVYFGQGAYGIQAAAKRYFSVDAKDLTLPQAAMLAGLVQSPGQDDPIASPENAQIRRDQVLRRMHALDHISDEELAEFEGTPVEVDPGQTPANGCIDARVGGFFCAWMLDYLTDELGITQQQLDTGGLTIRTTLRTDMQKAGDQAVLNTLTMGDSLAGIYTAVEPGTGHVLAMSVNRRFGCDGPECESVVLNDAPSQGSGSTYKTFVAAAALDKGYSKHYTISTSDPYTSRVYKKNGGTVGEPYTVGNAGNYPRTLDLERALYMSSNTYFLALEDALGSLEAPVRMAEAMGMEFGYGADPSSDAIIEGKLGSFTLGPFATSPLDLATAYSTLAASGTQCDPIPVTEILDRDGEPLLKDDGTSIIPESTCTEEAIKPGVANTLNQILRKDVEPGFSGQTGSRAYVSGHQIAGKTGTSQSNYSVAFVGYTPEYAASVMVLNPKRNQDVGGFGGGMPALIWHDAMEPILEGQETAAFPPADRKVEDGNTIRVPSCGGVDDCRSRLTSAGFRTVVGEIDSSSPAGFVVGTSPSEGARAVRGQTITIQVSNGSQFVEPEPEPDPEPENDGNGNGNGNGNGGGNGGGDGGGNGGGGNDGGAGGGGGGNEPGGGGNDRGGGGPG